MTVSKYTLVFLFFLSPAASADDWTGTDTAREAAYLTLHTIDWGQTRYIAKHPENHGEGNPILGDHPSIGEVNRYFIAAGILHVGVATWLPPDWRKWFQYVSIGVEAVVIKNNIGHGDKVDLGIHVDF